jgi:hypothetical protein
MVKNTFAQEFVEFVQRMETSKGPFTLAMLVPSESGLTDRWNLVVSAKWIDDKRLEPAIPTITSALLKHLSKPNVQKIARISPLSTRDSITRDVVEELEVEPSTAYKAHLFALKVRGIDEAIILAARDSVSSSSRHPQTARLRG